ncbi:MAG: PPK2 family polyphosphate kinase [Arachnia sp.]
MSGWTTDPREALLAGPGFDLAGFDRGATPGWEHGKKAGKLLTQQRGALLPELQERLFAEGRAGGRRAVLCVVQGIDTAGKGGIARHVMGFVDPQGVALRSFGVPTQEEREHHYLWRIRKALPPAGKLGVFDRSHYEDVLVVRVDELVPRDVWEPRYEEINQFEAELVADGITVVKFAMMVSYEEQGKRLMERLDRPDKRWKYSPGDLVTRSKWEAYQEAYQAVLQRTSTAHAPWYVLPADRKWYPRLAVTEILTRTLIGLRPAWPLADFDVAAQREQLAATMSTASLAESLAETDHVVSKAIEESLEVRADAGELIGLGHHTAARSDAGIRAGWESEKAATLAHKRGLLAARDDASPGSGA